MTKRYFTPREAALDLGRRMQLDIMRATSQPLGHALDVARAIRSLGALVGRPPGASDPVVWEPTPAASGMASDSAPAPSFLGSPFTPRSFAPPWGAATAGFAPGEWQTPSIDPRDGPTDGTNDFPTNERGSIIGPPGWPPNPNGRGSAWDAGFPQIPLPPVAGGTWIPTVPLPDRAGAAPTGNGNLNSSGGILGAPASPQQRAGMPAGGAMPSPDAVASAPHSSPGRAGSKSSGPVDVTVQVELLPKTVKDELWKIAARASRELRDFQHVCSMGNRGRR